MRRIVLTRFAGMTMIAALLASPALAADPTAPDTTPKDAKVAVASQADSDSDSKDSATNPDNKVKCRKVAVTGSLVKKTRVCRTVAQWREINRQGNRYATDIIDTANSGSTNGG